MGALTPFIMQVMAYLPAALKGVEEARDLIEFGIGRIRAMIDEDRDPSPQDWDELNAKIDAMTEPMHSDDR